MCVWRDLRPGRYQCDIIGCGKTFTHATNMYRHKRKQHQVRGHKEWSCGYPLHPSFWEGSYAGGYSDGSGSTDMISGNIVPQETDTERVMTDTVDAISGNTRTLGSAQSNPALQVMDGDVASEVKEVVDAVVASGKVTT